MEIKTDFGIIEQARQGDKAAFSRLVKLYQKKVYNLAWNLTGNHQEADDLAQETFIKVYRSIEKFRMQSEFKTWMYKIMVNAHIDKKRKKTMAPISHIADTLDHGKLAFHETKDMDVNNNPEIQAESAMINRHINKALNVLSAKEKRTFVLKHYQGLSIREIANIVQSKEGTVKSMLFRSIKKMQKALAFLKPDLGMEN